jgi:hydroxymethylglutaryl-CoA synthase
VSSERGEGLSSERDERLSSERDEGTSSERGERSAASETHTATRIVSVGATAPRSRLSADEIASAWDRTKARGIDSVAVPDADEDSLTLAAAAARRALDAAAVEPGSVALLSLATTTPPVEEPELTPRLGAFLGVPETAARRSHAGGTRAGTAALAGAVASDARPALVVAADTPHGEPNSPEGHAAGAGAAAVVLDDFEAVSTAGADESREPATASGAEILAHAEYASDYPGTRFRDRGATETDGLAVTSYDRAAFREPAVGAVEALREQTGDGGEASHADPRSVDALAITAPDGDRPARAAAAADLDPETMTTPVRTLGDTGAAGPLLGLARAFEAESAAPDDGGDAGGDTPQHTLLVGVGSGGSADATLVVGTAPVSVRLASERRVSYDAALRLRGEITSGEPAGGGAAVSVPTWRRSRTARYRLVAGECPECDALTFPPEGACSNCRSLVAFERVQLPRRGTVVTVTEISPGGAPPEFVPQAERGGDFPVGIVRFERDGASVDVPLQLCGVGGVGTASAQGKDTSGRDTVAAGDTVERVVRRIYEQEGVVRYGAKGRVVGE